MKKLIQKFFSKTRNVVLTIIVVLIVIFIIKHIYTSVQKNVQAMAEEAGETITYTPSYPVPNTSGKSHAEVEQIKRGEYLTKAGDCIACHTNSLKEGVPFAGGLPMQTPFGTIYSPNITPDKETGIGNWTEEQFITAMHKGLSPRGKLYYPAFPYLYFSKVTVEDIKAIKAYFDSIPPVHQVTQKNEMVWPFNWRFLQSGWRLLFFNPANTGPFKANPNQSEEWNRGAYLVEGLGHCAMCHTPSYYILSEKYPLGAPIKKYNLTGAKIQGYLAPNISKMNIESIPNEEFLQVFTHNRLIGGGKIEGPMLEANENSLKYLTRSDLSSIITYLKSVESKSPPKPKAGPGGAGKGIYQSYCEGCHASGAGGAPRFGDPGSWETPLKNGMPSVYTNAIKGINGMPAKGTCFTCTDQEVKEAVDYMVNAVSGKKAVAPLKKLTMADGKRIYEENCSVCHNTGFKGAPKVGDKQAFKASVKAGFLQSYLDVIMGRHGHPPRGGCADCSDADIKAAVKYMLTESSNQDYSLW